jgi:urease accessory protein UreE
VTPEALAGKQRDSVRLAWEERRWTRKRLMTTRGWEVALALPTGSVLHPGDVLAVEDTWYLAVEASAEPVLAALPRDRAEAIRVAFARSRARAAPASPDPTCSSSTRSTSLPTWGPTSR